METIVEKLEKEDKEKAAKEYIKHFPLNEEEAEFILREVKKSREKW